MIKMHLVVKTQIISAVRKINGKKGYRVKNVDASYLPALNDRVLKLLEESIERAQMNNRRTLMERDL